VLEQSVQASYSHIADKVRSLAHYLGGNPGFFGDRQISRTGSNYREDRPRWLELSLLEHYRPRGIFVSRRRKLARGRQFVEHLWCCTCRQDIIALAGKGLEYPDDLLRCLTRTVNNLRKASPDLAMMIHAGKAKVLKRQVAEFIDRLFYLQLAALDLLE